MRAAAALLTSANALVTQVAESAGYSSVHTFTRAFAAVFGLPPAQCRRTARDGRH